MGSPGTPSEKKGRRQVRTPSPCKKKRAVLFPGMDVEPRFALGLGFTQPRAPLLRHAARGGALTPPARAGGVPRKTSRDILHGTPPIATSRRSKWAIASENPLHRKRDRRAGIPARLNPPAERPTFFPT